MIGPSVAVCEHCLVRCDGWYEDDHHGRKRLVICPICGNGDPQLDVESWLDTTLPEDVRTLLRLMDESY